MHEKSVAKSRWSLKPVAVYGRFYCFNFCCTQPIFPQRVLTGVLFPLCSSSQHALTTMKFTPEQQFEVFKLLASILHLGNVSFLHVGSAQINDKTVVDFVAQLLGVDGYQLADCLITRVITVRGEEMSSPLTVEQVSIGF